MTRCKILGLTLIALLIATATPALAEAAPPAAAPAVAASSPVLTNCGQGLGLTGQKVQGEICPAAQPENSVPEFMAKPPRIRYCSCGCGATCTTDADCDGGVCINVITCC
jgi:hypothetical protein